MQLLQDRGQIVPTQLVGGHAAPGSLGDPPVDHLTAPLNHDSANVPNLLQS